MTIKDFLPPILVRFAKKTAGFSDSKEYATYDEALKHCSVKGYENEELCNMVADKTVILRERIFSKPYEVKPSDAYTASVINNFAVSYPGRTIKILDIGGACGAHYFESRRLISGNIRMNWLVVETEQMVRSALDKNLGNGELGFISTINKAGPDTDIIYSSSTLHYVPDPYDFTKAILKTGANQIFLTRMMFNENDRDFITVQRSFLSDNGPGPMPAGYKNRIIKYPHTTLSFPKLNSLMAENGYEPEWIFDELTGIRPVRNEKIIGKGILYIKKERPEKTGR